jgi:hypothetical protein
MLNAVHHNCRVCCTYSVYILGSLVRPLLVSKDGGVVRVPRTELEGDLSSGELRGVLDTEAYMPPIDGLDEETLKSLRKKFGRSYTSV